MAKYMMILTLMTFIMLYVLMLVLMILAEICSTENATDVQCHSCIMLYYNEYLLITYSDLDNC